MLTYVRGDLFSSPAKVLVNTVNTVGVMGKGIALTFKQVFPEMFERYLALCEAKRIEVGNLWLYRTEHKWVLNFPTKKHWRSPSKLEYLEAGLEKFVDTFAQEKITSIAFPQLGCGNGELEWEDVQPLMAKYLRPLPINVYIYLYDRSPNAKPEHLDIQRMRAWLRSEPKALPFEEFWSDLRSIVGKGFTARTAEGEQFHVVLVNFDSDGLLLHVGERTWLQAFRDDARVVVNGMLRAWHFGSNRAIFVPEEVLLDLWQNIRFFGFCHQQMMPDGLDVLAPYLMPILKKLSYLAPVKLAVAQGNPAAAMDDALQLRVSGTERKANEEQIQPVAV